MRTTHIRTIRTTLGLTMVGALALTACTTGDQAGFSDEEPEATSPVEPEQTPTTAQDADRRDVLVAEVDEPVEFEECFEAENIDGATVEWLDDVTIEEQRFEGVDTEIVEVDGQDVEIPGAPDIVVPERVGQGGCIIEYPAPGSCLPAVEISGSFIPGYTVPARTLPEVELPDGTVAEELVQDEISKEAIEQSGVFQNEVCQAEPDESGQADVIMAVARPAIARMAIAQMATSNMAVTRSAITTESGDALPSTGMPSYGLPSMGVGSASIESDGLESYKVDGSDHTEYVEKDETISYTTEGDVLFDSDDHQLRSDAETELQTIADDIADRDDDYSIRVEGHTDNLPSQEYADNDELSEDRAQSVADWLTDNTDVTSGEITAEGMGEDHPRSDNDTDEGRQQNRRVVVTVTPDDYEPEIDYETEE